MENSLGSRFRRAWNIFMNKDPTGRDMFDFYGSGSSYRPDRIRFSRGNEKSIITAIYNRIALDVAAIDIKHIKTDSDGRFVEEVDSTLNNCLSVEANIDQTGRSLIQDAVMSMFDEGCVAIAPVDTDDEPEYGEPGSFDIVSMRVAKIVEWYPQHVKIEIYNDMTGRKEQVKIAKQAVAIIENPLFAVINEPNSTMQRLIRKLSLLDVVDEESSSGKLDLIIQLPYIIKTEARRTQAENRRKDIEKQLSGSKYGIAYTDGTERITQLNRPVENNLLSQVEYLTNLLFSQLGITQEILNGSADEKTMLNYYNRTIEPILSAITGEMKRKFLTKNARTRGQTIEFFRDPFKLVPVADLAEIADKFTRNEIMTSNEIRQVIGMKPADDPRADQLINSNNLTQNETELDSTLDSEQDLAELDQFDEELDELENALNHSDELFHYASKYYDPIKAHEYYMKNRELVGRKSTSGLNSTGKEAAKYVKEKLMAEKKTKIESHKNTTDAQIESTKSQKETSVQAHKDHMNNEISRLRDELKSMGKEEKSVNKERIQAEISRLREENKQQRATLMEEFSGKRTSLREGHKTEKTRLNNLYDEKYIAELDKMKADKSLASKSRRKSSS